MFRETIRAALAVFCGSAMSIFVLLDTKIDYAVMDIP